MKRSYLKISFFVLAILCVAATEVSAQKRVVESREFWNVTSKARGSEYQKKRSIETVWEEYENGVVVVTRTNLYQYLASDNYRFYNKTETPTGVRAENEEIRVGDFMYRREKGGQWTKEDLRNATGTGGGSGTGSGSGAGTMAVSQLSVETVFLGSTPAELYERIEVAQEDKLLKTTELRYWIGQDGSLLQEEKVEANFSPRAVTNRMIKKYEYDPNIKIEAPIK